MLYTVAKEDGGPLYGVLFFQDGENYPRRSYSCARAVHLQSQSLGMRPGFSVTSGVEDVRFLYDRMNGAENYPDLPMRRSCRITNGILKLGSMCLALEPIQANCLAGIL